MHIKFTIKVFGRSLAIPFLFVLCSTALAEESAELKDSFIFESSDDPYMHGYEEIASVLTVDIAPSKEEVRISDTTVLAEADGEVLTVVSEDIAPSYFSEDSVASTSVAFFSENLNAPAGCPGDSGPTGDSGDSGTSGDAGSSADSGDTGSYYDYPGLTEAPSYGDSSR
jgi:hypothetical protein